MLNIKSLFLGNFRIFPKTVGISLAPITILTGPNSSGKSSVAKSLFLMKDIDTRKVPFKLRFDEVQNNFGSFDMITNNTTNDNEIVIGYSVYNIILGEDVRVFFTFEKEGDFDAIVKEVKIDNKSGTLFSFEFKGDEIVSSIGVNYLLQKLKEIKNSKSLYLKIKEATKDLKIGVEFDHKNKDFIACFENNNISIKEFERLYYFFGDQYSLPGEESSEDDFIAKINKILADFSEDSILFNNDLLIRILEEPVNTLNEEQIKAIIEKEFPDLAESISEFDASDSLNQVINDLKLNNYSDLESNVFAKRFSTTGPKYSIIDSEEISMAINGHINFLFESTPFFKALLNITIAKSLFLHSIRIIEFPQNVKELSSFASLIFSKTIHDIKNDLGKALLIPLQNFNPGILVNFDHPLHKLVKNYSTLKKKDPFLKDWFKEFNLCEDFSIETPLKGLGYFLSIKKNDENISLSNEGTGTNHLLTMLLGISNAQQYCDLPDYTYNYKNFPRTIVLEEPEANMHPAWQSKLADMFIDANKRLGLHFMIETHSEYIIRKFQYLIAKKQIDKNDVKIIYFDIPDEKLREAGAPQMRKILIDENGNLSQEFGKGFFDEADNLAIDLFNLNRLNKN